MQCFFGAGLHDFHRALFLSRLCSSLGRLCGRQARGLRDVLKFFGIAPHAFFTVYSVQIGSAFTALLLSFALADRIKALGREKEAVQRLVHRAVLYRQNFLELEVRSLHERMRPHFLFNVLETVNRLVHEDARLAERAVLMLAEVCRFNLERAGEGLVSLEEEICFTENFLELERIRLQDALDVRVRREGDFSSALIAPFTLQPIAENCIKHAFRGDVRALRIDIFVRIENDALVLQVADNGAGFDTADPFARTLGNIRRRLRHFFMEADIDIGVSDSGGALVTVRCSLQHAARGTNAGPGRTNIVSSKTRGATRAASGRRIP